MPKSEVHKKRLWVLVNDCTVLFSDCERRWTSPKLQGEGAFWAFLDFSGLFRERGWVFSGPFREVFTLFCKSFCLVLVILSFIFQVQCCLGTEPCDWGVFSKIFPKTIFLSFSFWSAPPPTSRRKRWGMGMRLGLPAFIDGWRNKTMGSRKSTVNNQKRSRETLPKNRQRPAGRYEESRFGRVSRSLSS